MTMDTSSRWTAADLGAAMVAHYTSTAKGWRNRSDGVDGPAAYRDGDNPASFRIVEARGVAMDARAGRSFNAKQYAEEIIGCTLPEMMERYGRGAPPRVSAEAPSAGFPPADEVAQLWGLAVPVDEVPEVASSMGAVGSMRDVSPMPA